MVIVEGAYLALHASCLRQRQHGLIQVSSNLSAQRIGLPHSFVVAAGVEGSEKAEKGFTGIERDLRRCVGGAGCEAKEEDASSQPVKSRVTQKTAS